MQLEVLGGALPILGDEPFVSGRNKTQEDVIADDALGAVGKWLAVAMYRATFSLEGEMSKIFVTPFSVQT